MKTKIAILTSPENWLIPYAKLLSYKLKILGYESKVFTNEKGINEKFKIVFILTFYRILKNDFLRKHKHNLVVHGSDLPKGKGWAPIFWQILQGKNNIPIVLFEASEKMDEGDIYIKDVLKLNGHELYDEVRNAQGLKTISICLRFIKCYKKLLPKKQNGKSSVYPKRGPRDSELDINKSIKEQFNLLRITSNKDFPAFFNYKKNIYFLKITKKE